MFRNLVLAALVVLSVYGCAKKADTSKSIEQIQSEVQTMSLKDLEANAKSYVDAIAAKKSDLDKVQQQLGTIKPTEIFSDKAKDIKNQLSAVTSEVSALTERYNVYAQKYQALGGDVSKIKLG